MTTYARKIEIGDRNFTSKVNTCSFNWDRLGGCKNASLTIEEAAFDDFMDIDIGDKVEIMYGTSSASRWWIGAVAELETSLPTGLSVQCIGLFVLMEDIKVIGRFGSEVETKAVLGLASSVDDSSGELTAATYKYQVTTTDGKGETLVGLVEEAGDDYVEDTVTGSTNTITISWDAAQGAQGYRVYRTADAESTWVYFDVSDLSFEDDGTTTGTETDGPPDTATSWVPTIEDFDVDDVVKYLLTNFLPSDLSYEAADITSGATVELDDYDLMNGDATLLDVISTLADIAGDTAWGVDEDGKVYFKPGDDDYTTGHTLKVGKEATGFATYVKGASRRKTRDGVSNVKIEGEPALDDGSVNAGETLTINFAELFGNDLPIENDDYVNIFYGPVTSGLPGGTTGGGVINVFFNSEAGLNIYGTAAAIPLFDPATVDYFKTGGELKTEEDMEDDFFLAPCLYDVWILLHKDKLHIDVLATRVLRQVNLQIDAFKRKNSSRFDGSFRGREILRYSPGIKTADLATMAAMSSLERWGTAPDTWNISLDEVTELLIPGQGGIRLYTQGGKRYDLAVQSVSYTFGESTHASISAGDREYTPEEELKDVSKAVAKISRHKPLHQKWIPYRPS
jgi:hypothetical protein